MTNRTEVLLKDLTPDMILVQSDHAKETMPPGAGECDPAGLPHDQVCYLKLATAEQLHALRLVFPHAIAVIEWPESVARNRERIRRSLRRARPGPQHLIPEYGRRFVFETAAVLALFAACQVADAGKYYRVLDSCAVLATSRPPAGAEEAILKEPPGEWFSGPTRYEQAHAPCDCPDCEARNRP
jgi:hypothetical protein